MKKYNLFMVVVLVMTVCSIASCEGQVNNSQGVSDESVWSSDELKQLQAEARFDLDESYQYARTLNDSGVSMVNAALKYQFNNAFRDSLLVLAIQCFDLSIDDKRDYYYAYLNKANALRELKRYDQSIQTLNELLKVNSNHADALFTLALLHEKTGRKHDASEYYSRARKRYEELLNTPMATEADMSNYFQLLLFIEGKDSVLAQLRERLLKAPTDGNLLVNMEIARQFDRVKYFEEF